MTGLVRRWCGAARGAGATGPEAALAAVGEELLRRWREPHRHYHTVNHLGAVLDVIDAETERPTGTDLLAYAGRSGADLVRLAAWCHDAIYDPRSPGDANERASAALAAELLTGLGLPADAVAEVVRLVLLTAGHRVEATDRNGALLCDADLAILAAPAARYDAYAAAIRREYAHVPDELFRAGRAAVLRNLLDLPTRYRLPDLAARWEGPARANLTRELARLDPGTAPGRSGGEVLRET
ncbi:putative metal-dependent HD superfamily phosphohydrolase [Micromonospora pisi]|uniref:Putative metal-dependent HD superfamily phosphohydrolase n=1 Tax=Micromonospora pisi TaxID=589240 RepID=A0A495JJ58_9ACTN|nr:metal-dependent phosphohydrolase [Micromonospora pisi]RKR88851.1 putative metal-dependent HD superfamily phosphohydrolase [Micromonospora pisi]